MMVDGLANIVKELCYQVSPGAHYECNILDEVSSSLYQTKFLKSER